MYYKVKFVEPDGAIQNMCMYHKREIQKWINNNDVSIMKVTKITRKSETDITDAFSIKNLSQESSYIDTDIVSIAPKQYIHENELEYIIPEMWNKLYNNTPFTPYDEKYLKDLYKDLFNFDRENRWIVIHASVNYDIWMQAYDEHRIISKLIAKIFAYIEPFDYIENLIKPYTSEEETCYKEKWGMLI